MNRAFGGLTFRAYKYATWVWGQKVVGFPMCYIFDQKQSHGEIGILSGLALAISFRSASLNIEGGDPSYKLVYEAHPLIIV